MRYIISFLCFVLFFSLDAYAKPVRLIMKTEVGDVTFEVYPTQAPETVANFLRHVDNGYYQASTFYRTVRMNNQAQNEVKIEVLQGGIGVLEAKGAAKKPSPFPPVYHEDTDMTGLLHKDGTISMARDAPGTATSEFFICINDQPSLDFGGRRNTDGKGFAAFGKVVDGMDIIRHIQAMRTEPPTSTQYTSGQILVQPVRILSVERE